MGKTFSTGLLTNGIWQDASNNIGIGGSPSGSFKLDVNGNSKVLNNLTISSTTNAALIAATNSTTGYTYIDIINNGASGRNYQIGLGGNAAAAGYANNLYFDLVGVGNIMTLTSGRNVGIGTSSPAQNTYGINRIFEIGGSSVPGIVLRSTSTTGEQSILTGGDGLIISSTGSANASSDNIIRFFTGATNSSYAATERMRITSSGNVRIVGGGDLEIYPLSGSSYTAMYNDNDNFSIWNNGSERMRIAANGNIGVGQLPNADCKFNVRGVDSSSTNISLYSSNSNGQNLFYTRNDGAINTGNAPASPYNLTVATSANIFVDTAGFLYRTTSSLKYKNNVKDYNKGLNEVMQLRPVTYESKSEIEKGVTFAGLIAEEVHDLGLTEFVQYAEDGTPDALSYSNMVSLLVKAIQELSAKVSALENKS
jgi:hypothetical protein